MKARIVIDVPETGDQWKAISGTLRKLADRIDRVGLYYSMGLIYGAEDKHDFREPVGEFVITPETSPTSPTSRAGRRWARREGKLRGQLTRALPPTAAWRKAGRAIDVAASKARKVLP